MRSAKKTSQGRDDLGNYQIKVLSFIKRRQYKYQQSHVPKLIQLWVSSLVQTYACPCNITLHKQMMNKNRFVLQKVEGTLSLSQKRYKYQQREKSYLVETFSKFLAKFKTEEILTTNIAI